MELEGKQIAILAEDLYEDLELWYPYYRLKEAGATVKVVGSGRNPTHASKHGLPVTPDLTIESARVADFDAVVIPGGYSPDLMRRKPEMVKFVRDMDAAGKTVAAICHAGWMLVSAGIVKDRPLTGFHSIKDDLVAAGARYQDSPVVVDRNLVTSRMPADLPDFCRTIIGQLAKKPAAVAS
ncbi:MAG: type 1 glutamine amidotransferase [Chloroflexi bacterium]|nr:MAG: type 1 glutamine amidotransferase [Chloroflexota bacterium]TME17551.1 MAG: type 1 glutamine amidotransferase [Chloroflexota bacterium]TME19516.1 MAG: type 1 glutamine amidotransferase [Chloroflexota bacterium]